MESQAQTEGPNQATSWIPQEILNQVQLSWYSVLAHGLFPSLPSSLLPFILFSLLSFSSPSLPSLPPLFLSLNP